MQSARAFLIAHGRAPAIIGTRRVFITRRIRVKANSGSSFNCADRDQFLAHFLVTLFCDKLYVLFLHYTCFLYQYEVLNPQKHQILKNHFVKSIIISRLGKILASSGILLNIVKNAHVKN
jgi:hypothetical protein